MPETRKQEFVGIIKKCPNCGQILKSFQAKCPACGLELQEIEVSKGAIKFAEYYAKIEDEKQRIEWVKNFPVPNSREDLIEFALLANQQVCAHAKTSGEKWKSLSSFFSDFREERHQLNAWARMRGKVIDEKLTDEDFFIAWKQKFDFVYKKAKISFADDPQTLAQFEILADEVKKANEKLEAAKAHHKTNRIFSFVGLGLFLSLFYVVLPIVLSTRESPTEKETARLERLETDIQSDISNGNFESAELKLSALRWQEGSADNNYYKADRETWDAKREVLQKQIDSKKGDK